MEMSYSTATNIAKQNLSQIEFEAFKYFWSRKDMITLGSICIHDKAELVRVKEMINKALNENPNISFEKIKPSKEGRVIVDSATVNIPVIEVGKTMFSYPRTHKFEYVSVDYKGYLEFVMNEKNNRLTDVKIEKSKLLEHFEKITELNVKNIKKVKGHEGELCFQCSIYFKNTKIADYNGYEWYSGHQFKILDKNLLKETHSKTDNFFILDPKDKKYKITNVDFINLIEEMCRMKKEYGMII